jgi:nitrate reductase NapE component
MPTKSMLKAFDEFASKMQIYAPTHCSITWDSKKQKLVYNRFFSNPKTILWHFNMFFNVECGLVGGTGLILLMQLLGIGVKMSIVNICICIVIGLLGGFGWVVHMLTFLYGEDGVNGWNDLMELEEDLNCFGEKLKNYRQWDTNSRPLNTSLT